MFGGLLSECTFHSVGQGACEGHAGFVCRIFSSADQPHLFPCSSLLPALCRIRTRNEKGERARIAQRLGKPVTRSPGERGLGLLVFTDSFPPSLIHSHKLGQCMCVTCCSSRGHGFSLQCHTVAHDHPELQSLCTSWCIHGAQR